MRRLTLVLACASFVVLTSPLFAQKSLLAKSSAAHLTMEPAAAPTITTIAGNPLTVIVGSDTAFQLINSAFPGTGQIFPGGCVTDVADAGIFASINGVLYGPDFGNHVGCGSASWTTNTPWTPVSISGVLGSGTSADPYRVTVVVDAGTTGVRLTANYTYVNGQSYFTMTKTFCSTGNVSMNVYVGADLYLAGSDAGIPYVEPTSQSPGGKDCSISGYTILLVPTTPADFYAARGYSTVWSEINSQGDLSNIVDSGCIDNGAALEWKRTLTAGSCVTLSWASSFGAIPTITSFSIGSVNPAQGAPGQTLTVTISGIGFQSGTTFDFGPGITVNSTTINNSNQATVSISIAPTATPGSRTVSGNQTPSGPSASAPGAFTVTGTTTCPAAPTAVSPQPNSIASSGVLTWSGTADQFNVYFGRGGAGCSALAGTTTGNSFRVGLQPGTTYSYRIEGITASCPVVSTPCVSFRTAANPCPTAVAIPRSPAAGASGVTSPVTFQWDPAPGATRYNVYVAVGTASFRAVGSTTGNQLQAEVGEGPVSWFVEAVFTNNCTTRSPVSGFNAVPGCASSISVPKPKLVALIRSGEPYHYSWDAVPGAVSYDVQESTSSGSFPPPGNTEGTSLVSTHNVTKATAYYYRVRAKNACGTVSDYSEVLRIVVVPPDPPTLTEFAISTEFGNTRPLSQDIFIPGEATAVRFSATTDRSWLTVTPATGTLPPEGVTLTVTANPTGLPVGSTTGTVIVTTETLSMSRSVLATTSKKTVPVSVSLTTPISPTVLTAPTANTLVLPAVAHADGLNSVWRSNVRLANIASRLMTYQVSLVTSATTGGLAPTSQTASVQVGAGSTLALDDIVKNWFGFGPLGDGANGVLQIRPMESTSRFETVAGSRAYNSTPAGTFGQFVPGISFANFVGAAARLILQPITQDAQFRTNLGVVEGSGSAAKVTARLFNSSGALVTSQLLDLKAGEQLQIPASFTQNATNGWIELSVDPASVGKVTAYTSLVDNRSGDGNLFTAANPATIASNRYVVAGVGHTLAGAQLWRSNLTVLNAGSSATEATLTFSAQGSADRPTAKIQLAAGELKSLDDVAKSLFGAENAFGAIVVDTAASSSLVLAGRTYTDTADGSVGQAVPAFTPADAATANGRALQILNVEESERYRSNLGLAEVSGSPVRVDVTAHDADSLVSPTISIDLGPNEFVQLSGILRQFGFDRSYNGRLSVSVSSGTGTVAAYASTVDNRTGDPMYVPAQ